jgi:hypothetical protein
MNRLKDRCEPDSCDYWAVSKAAGNLTNQACTLAARHIKDGTLRLQFNREVSYYARGIVNDVAQGRKSADQGLKEIKNEQNSLLSQSWEVAKKGAGVVAGGIQILTGAGVCYGSGGTLCLVFGGSMMLHGVNNIYENGRNLLEDRTDTQGPTRKVYQSIAKGLGQSEREGNIAYATADIATSVFGLFRNTLKPDAWRLFRYIKTDYARSYKNMGPASRALEAHTNYQTTKQILQEIEK